MPIATKLGRVETYHENTNYELRVTGQLIQTEDWDW